jgi:hypothetical protein
MAGTNWNSSTGVVNMQDMVNNPRPLRGKNDPAFQWIVKDLIPLMAEIVPGISSIFFISDRKAMASSF